MKDNHSSKKEKTKIHNKIQTNSMEMTNER